MFSDKDIAQIEQRGNSINIINQQINNFKNGFPFACLISPATKDHGILIFNDEQTKELENLYFAENKNYIKCKFVPASGAASRMFSHLHSFCEKYSENNISINDIRKDSINFPVFNFIDNLKTFAFYDELKNKMLSKGEDIENCISKDNYTTIIKYLLNDIGLGYASLPKGLLSFHKYGKNVRTAIEEHLAEGALHCNNKGNQVNIHFTLSPGHIQKFNELISEKAKEYKSLFDVNYNISHSVQELSTDTIAVDLENRPFREADGSLLFRPGGHGALINNLNKIGADIIFIKNIDNITTDKFRPETIKFKHVIGGLLIRLQKRIFSELQYLSIDAATTERLNTIETFCKNELMIRFNDNFSSANNKQKQEILFKILNRPIRVCGMVKNEGEPGGGPYFTKNSKGDISLQIIESSQVDHNNPEQENIFRAATHFNPVDIVCGVKDYMGNKFDLSKYIDPETGFISIKTKDGRNLKAQELPGLWNGAMAEWITIFVEVPIITFNPVKTVNDLLRKEHL